MVCCVFGFFYLKVFSSLFLLWLLGCFIICCLVSMYLWIFQISFWFHFWFHPIVIGKLFLIISIFENLLRLVLLPNRESLLCIMFVPCALKKNEWIKPEPVESHNVFCDLASEIIFHHLCLILWATQANLTQFGKDFINAWISGVGIICWSLTTTVFSLVPSDFNSHTCKRHTQPFLRPPKVLSYNSISSKAWVSSLFRWSRCEWGF